eukprot:CAMPEP_0194439998 /NCGR_PEP_ID=MMETSP0176-20130528/113515_1 /TAXON_ID=216777 /ORGANISM="Proboscia alata, Strain PI-D3" /LENGTH=56 /DNA_ID=CAMNT_0039263805 /DNA_START=62 /DNA_END=229 /DNA_ORIENTATION=+
MTKMPHIVELPGQESSSSLPQNNLQSKDIDDVCDTSANIRKIDALTQNAHPNIKAE